MPYIKPELRERLLGESVPPSNVGELNYAISFEIHNYLMNRGGINYTNLNEVIGVLECAKAEFLRTVVAPYEDKKRFENGSVSEFDDVSREQMR